MRCQAVVRGVVVFLLLGVLCGRSGLVAAESAGKSPRDALAGQVVDPAGKPAVGAAVWLVGESSEDSPQTLETAETDAQGRFVFREAKARFARPKSGTPHLVARDTQGRLGGEPYPWAWSWATPTPRRDVQIKLVEVRDYRGRLLDAAGQPIPKAMIRPQTIDSAGLDDPAHRGIGLSPELAKELEFETGADGTFTLRRFPVRGSVVSKVTAAGFGSPRVAWDLTDSVTLRLERVGGIRGTLVAGPGATGLDALKLYLYSNPSPAKAKSPGPRVYYSATTWPGKDGKFGFDDVPPGSCTIDPALYSSNLPYYVQGRTSFEVKPGQTASVEVRLLPAAAVRGRVIDSRSGRGIAGVGLWAGKVSDSGYLSAQRHTATDADGRFTAYTEPGKIAVGVENAPDGYVVPVREGESPRMEAIQEVTWPPIKLEPAARLEGIVVDESGKPAPDAEVQCLAPRRGSGVDIDIHWSDAHGKFSMGGLLAKETLALRARTDTAVSDVTQLRPADITGPVRLVVSSKKAFAIRGVCVDAAGLPIRQAKVEVSSAWMLGPRGVGFRGGSCEADAEGRFEIRAVWPGSQYSFSVSAEGYDKFESEQFQAGPGQVRDAGRPALVSTGGFVEGIVADSAGRPVAGVRVFNSGDAPKVLTASTDAAGRFRLEGFRIGPVYVFAEKEGYRFTGVRTEAKRSGLRIQLLRSDGPAPPWSPQRPPLSVADEQKAVRRLLEKLWATPPYGRESSTIQFMARIDPQQALRWSAELGGRHADLVHRVVAERGAENDAEEVLASLAQCPDWQAYSILKSLAGRYAGSEPEKALRFAEEMILRARRQDQPDRTSSLAGAGALVVRLGKVEAGKKLIEEAAGMAAKMGTDGRQGYVRGLVATALAPFDLARAMGLVEPVAEKNERERALARIATAIAPKDLNKALEILGRVDKRSTLPDLARTQIAYELVPTRREDAMRVVEGMDSYAATKMKAEALGWVAKAVAPRDRQFAHSLIDKSMAIYCDQAEVFRGWSSSGGRTAFAAHVVVQAREIGYPDMGLLINRVLAMRPAGTDVWSPRDSQHASILTATILALVDPECAKQLLLSVAPEGSTAEGAGSAREDAELLPAWALADLDHAVELIESQVEASKGNNFWTDGLIRTLDLLTSPPDQRAEVVLRHSGGRWFPGTEL